jgi:hypothetical protein
MLSPEARHCVPTTYSKPSSSPCHWSSPTPASSSDGVAQPSATLLSSKPRTVPPPLRYARSITARGDAEKRNAGCFTKAQERPTFRERTGQQGTDEAQEADAAPAEKEDVAGRATATLAGITTAFGRLGYKKTYRYIYTLPVQSRDQ